MRKLIAALAVVVLVVPAFRAEEKEEKVPLDKLPKAVVEAVKAKFEGAKLVSAEKEKEDGKTVYEVNIKHKGHTIEVTVTPEGKIVSVEKTIEAKDLPEAVAAALKKKYPKATIKKIEELSKDDKVTGYEVLLTSGKKTVEVVFDPSGKVTKTESKGEKKEDKDKKD
jgi:uncharacterized membrane protein YkoI